MELVNDLCAICNHTSLVEVYPPSILGEREDNLNASDYKCTSMAHNVKPLIAKCTYCNMVQIPKSWQPKNLLQTYGDVVDEDYLDNFQVKKKTFSYAYKKIKKYTKKNGLLLEIGSYCGLFLIEASNNGQFCTGIEPSRWAASFSQEHLKECTIINLPLEEATRTIDIKFDTVISWDVIEHVQNPLKVMNDASALLKDKGYFIFSTIMFDSWLARVMGKKWHWIMDMHLYYFTEQSIQYLLDNSGFKLIESGGYRHYASIKYAFRKLCFCFPPSIARVMAKFEKIVPNIVIPFTLGDVKYFVVQKS